MATLQRGKLIKKGSWQVEIDEGSVNLTEYIKQVVDVQKRLKKKASSVIQAKIEAALLSYEGKHVEIELTDSGTFRIQELKPELA